MVRRGRGGFSLLELLLALAVMGLLVGLAATAIGRLRGPLTLEQASEQFAQDVQVTRARALASGNGWRLRIVSARQYALEEVGGGAWSARLARSLPAGETLANVQPGDTLAFDTRGFGTFALSGTPGDEVWLTDGNATVRIVPSMTGAVRTVAR